MKPMEPLLGAVSRCCYRGCLEAKFAFEAASWSRFLEQVRVAAIAAAWRLNWHMKLISGAASWSSFALLLSRLPGGYICI